MTPWPLVGRQGLLDEVVRALRRRQGAGVVLLGEEGVGKSRLANEALAEVRRHGMAVLPTVATAAAATLPFGALADLLPPAQQTAASPYDLMRLAAGRLRATAPRQGLVLAVDDAHLLDDASAALVAHAVRSGAARVLLVVRELAPGPDALLGLLGDGPCTPVRVAKLGHGDLVQLCSAVLGGPVEGTTLRRLEELSAGNLLHLRELLEAGLADGTLTQERGVWRSSVTRITNRRLSSVVEQRLARLSEVERSVVELTALAGTVEVPLLERVHGTAAVVAVERAGLLTVSEDDRRLRARVSSPLYAEVLRSSTPRLAARLHRSHLARELAGTPCRRKDDVLRLVLARLEAGDVPDESLLLSAGRAARQRYDSALAVRLTTAAVEVGGSFAARLACAEALYACGRAEQAESLLASLQDDAETPEQLGRIALARGANLLSGFGRAAEAEELLRTARSALEDGELRDELAALGGLLALTRGQSQRALDEVEPVLARPEEEGRAKARVRALLVALSAWGQVGRAETAVAVGERVRQEAQDDELASVVEVALVGLCYAYGVLGRFDEAEQLARGRYDAALDQRAPDLRTLWALALGQAALARGDLARADAHLREAAVLLRSDQSVLGVYSLAWCLGCLGEVCAARGDAAAARAAVDEAFAVTPEPCFIASRELARVWLSWAERSSASAAEVASEVAAGARERGQHAVEAIALHQAARLGHPDDVADRLAALALAVDGELVAAHAAHARALRAADGALLLSVSRTYERLGVWLEAAESAAAAAGCFARRGRPLDATGAAQRTSSLVARCPGARTPGLVLGVEPQPLTAREREVAGLAARGWTTSEIAEALVLSVRTVDNHLHRAYGKLGISSRRELAAVFSPADEGVAGGRSG